MDIICIKVFDEPFSFYINTRKHEYYGYRASISSPFHMMGVWEDSRNSKEEALGKLVIRLCEK